MQRNIAPRSGRPPRAPFALGALGLLLCLPLRLPGHAAPASAPAAEQGPPSGTAASHRAAVAAASHRAAIAAPSPASAPSPAALLAQLADDYWRHELADDVAARLHQHLPITALPDLSLEHLRQNAVFCRALLARLAAIDPAGLGEEDRLSFELLRWEAALELEGPGIYWHLFQVTPNAAPFREVHLVFASHPFTYSADLDSYLRLLRQYPALVTQLRSTLAGQRTRGILLPKPEIDVVTAMLRGFIRPAATAAASAEQSPLAVAPGRLAKLDPAATAPFQAAVARSIAEEVNPALESLVADLGESYRRAAPDRVGLGQYPGGDAVYRLLVRYRTTLDLSPNEIHLRGLAEVARIEREMAEVRRRLGFAGPRAAFHRRLRSDPRFFARTPEEVAARLMAPIRRIEPRIGSYFLRLPKASYTVERLAPALEGGLTFGYFEMPSPADPRGVYKFNGSHLEERPLLDAAALIYHELIPGHHFQLARQAENEALPPFRRDLYHTAYVEGWGEYASALAREMGMYEDPYDLYGRLSMDMLLSVRLVVDIGMNAFGWSRERAIAYMRDNELQSDTQIGTETLRYSTDIPAQALAYKLGSLKLHELRARAERELGPRYDIRRFHEAVLSSGSLPLPILERHLDRWIAQEKLRPASP